MNIFPLLGNINGKVLSTIQGRAGNNVDVSKLIPWIRVASGAGGGLILQSAFQTTFEQIYGDSAKSGMVGLDFTGTPVYADSSERGLRPSPIVEGAEVQTGHLGLSRKSTFSIKCFTLGQAEKIVQHFLEPGYHVLIEFGWNLPESLGQAYGLSACEMAKFSIYDYVIDKRVASNGTYDGFMGQITGGSLTYGEGETYIVNVEITTIGEIPAYLQTQKGAIPANKEKLEESTTGLKFNVSEIDQAADSEQIGELLYMQMYNRLPSHKRTQAIKDLRNKPDRYGRVFKSKGNFVNVDDTVRQSIMDNFDTLKNTKGDDVTIPDGVNLISQESFIRLELAFAIMNNYTLDIESKPGGCGGVRTYSYKIDTANVVIRAHKHIFSTDDTKLYIPNQFLPDFGIETLISATTETNIGSLANTNTVYDGNPWKFDEITDYTFPSLQPLQDVRGNDVYSIKDIPSEQASALEWGYLENLYINLDFFIDVLNRSNYVAKDVYYEILNGLSEASNSYWQFEIVEQPDRNRKDKDGNPLPENIKPMKLMVADLSFTGQTSRNKFTSTFDPIGTNTPFLNFNINMDIPAIMRNSILGKRASVSAELNIDGKDARLTKLFNGPNDKVADIINSFAPKTPTEDTTAATDESSGDNLSLFDKAVIGSQGTFYGGVLSSIKNASDRNKNQKTNLEAFAEKGVIIPLIQDRNQVKDTFLNADDTAEIGEFFVVGVYNDVIFLKLTELALVGDSEVLTNATTEPGQTANPAILAIEVTFEVHGISGLRVGDVFKLNKLPRGYDKPFQIMEINHSLTGNQWTTSVKAKMRNM
jgi:hypothetical protein